MLPSGGPHIWEDLEQRLKLVKEDFFEEVVKELKS